jgi:hypothetical protein
LEPFDLVAGRGVVRSGVLLADVQSGEEVLEGVVGGVAAVGETGGEHHAVVCQRGERNAVCAGNGLELGDDDVAGDRLMCRDGQGVACMIIEPEDFGVGAVGEGPVGEVGLPGLDWLLGLEADVRRLRSLLRFRVIRSARRMIR